MAKRASDRKTGKVLVIACGALAREIGAVIELNRLDHMELRCLPASLHLYPDKITGAVREAIFRGRRDGFSEIVVGYADCGTGGLLDAMLRAEGVARIGGPHCYAFYTGLEAFAARDEITAFYLTDFLARQFDAFVIKPLGLDRHPELRDAYFGHYERLVYLAQTDDPTLDARARAAAERLGLAYERRRTGYGDLAPFLRQAAE